MYKLVIFVPENSVEKLKDAVFATGAGSIGNYVECCWEGRGIGQFRPVEGSNPFIGSFDQLEKVPEVRLEVLCTKVNVRNAIDAMHAVHPYEKPAFEVIELVDVESI